MVFYSAQQNDALKLFGSFCQDSDITLHIAPTQTPIQAGTYPHSSIASMSQIQFPNPELWVRPKKDPIEVLTPRCAIEPWAHGSTGVGSERQKFRFVDVVLRAWRSEGKQGEKTRVVLKCKSHVGKGEKVRVVPLLIPW